jgi:hypothetical protein
VEDWLLIPPKPYLSEPPPEPPIFPEPSIPPPALLPPPPPPMATKFNEDAVIDELLPLIPGSGSGPCIVPLVPHPPVPPLPPLPTVIV